jgi:hypothetical protein
MVIDDANLILQAPLDGQGVALGILPFVQDELSNGRLVRPFELSIDPGLPGRFSNVVVGCIGERDQRISESIACQL